VTAAPPRTDRVLMGIGARLAAVVAMGVMTAIVKICGERGVHVFEIIFFRNAFAFVPILAYILMTDGTRVLRTTRPLGHLTRAVVGMVGMGCGFAAVAMMPLAEYTAIQFASPLFITALSALVLKERVDGRLWAAIVSGFLGVLIMVRPDPAQVSGLGPVLAIVSALGASGAMIAIREIGRTEPGPTIVFYFTLFATLFGAAGLPFVWTQPDWSTLGLLVLCGLCGGVGQLFLTQAFKLAPAAVVAPFDYASLLWAGVLGWLIWNEFPKKDTLAGGAIVVASGLYIVWRETRRRRQGR
jgi:drug/metabolite transporter (DMT)-like permease